MSEVVANDNEDPEIKSCIDYLLTGGIGEMMIGLDYYKKQGHKKVQNDTDLEIAMLILASKVTDLNLDALERDLIIECERAMKQRDEFLRTGIVINVDTGAGWDTCFGFIVRKYLGLENVHQATA